MKDVALDTNGRTWYRRRGHYPTIEFDSATSSLLIYGQTGSGYCWLAARLARELAAHYNVIAITDPAINRAAWDDVEGLVVVSDDAPPETVAEEASRISAELTASNGKLVALIVDPLASYRCPLPPDDRHRADTYMPLMFERDIAALYIWVDQEFRRVPEGSKRVRTAELLAPTLTEWLKSKTIRRPFLQGVRDE